MRRKIIMTLIIITTVPVLYFFFVKANIYFESQPPKDINNLRSLILRNIDIPFKQADTLIVETTWGFCGNSKRSELPIVFDTRLSEPSYVTELSKKNRISVLTMNDFNKIMDTILKYKFHGVYPKNLWDTCRRNKVHAEIHAEKLSIKMVRTYENYLYNNFSKFIQKDFVFKDNMWTFLITDSLTQNLVKSN